MTLPIFDPNKLIETISVIIVAVLGVLYGILRFFGLIGKKEDNFLAIHSQIHELLTELRVTSKAMRASVIQFHNGDYTLDGISMKKFSVTHESTYKGYTSQMTKLKGNLCSMYIPLLTKVVENKSVIHYTHMLPHSYVKGFFEDENVSEYACLPLKNKGANVGFVLVQWHHDFEVDTNTQESFPNNFDHLRDSIQMQLSQQKN